MAVVNKAHVIAELGINHNGSEKQARELIDAAAQAGVWGVKFQYRNLANSYAGGDKQIGDEILQEEIKRNFLTTDQIMTLTDYGKKQGLSVGISFFSPEDCEDFGVQIDVFDFFKVPSVEFTNLPLIEHIEKYQVPSLISTGAYTEARIRDVLGHLDPKIWTPMHCVSNYPVSIVNSRLGYIQHLQGRWAGPVGYSSHDEYWETCLLALQLGATVIERHITMDKNDDGLDHSSSSTPDEFSRLVAFANTMNLVMAGNVDRVPNQGELLNLQNLGRSYYAKSAIQAGKTVGLDDIVLRSPRVGLGQEEAQNLLGKKAVRNVNPGSVIDRSVFLTSADLSDDIFEFARAKALSLPVRFHDFEPITNRFPIGRYEFHLSFRDMEEAIDVAHFSSDHEYSVHLPDYISPTQLIDPFSTDAAQRHASHAILEKTAVFAKKLEDRTGARAPVVGSFSVLNGSLETFYSDVAALVEAHDVKGIQLMPQWLPPIAWYFGGAVGLSVMNNVEDVAFLKRLKIPICMDVCHLAMGDTVFDLVADEVIDDLRSNIGHLHLADAVGFDGEGVGFGDGDVKNQTAIEKAMSFDCAKVVEVWQGHLDQGAGFAAALLKLNEMFGSDA